MSDIGMTAKQPDNPRIKVSHVGDFSQVVPDGMLLVESDHGYAKVCQQLIDHADASDGAEVWVRQESHFRWLTSFVDQTGIAASFERQTPRRLLAARWDVSVPAWLEDQAVLAQDLLGMVPPKHKADNFQQALLVTCLGAPVGSKVLNEENLTAVLASLTDANAKQQFTKYPCLRQCLDDVCTGWADSSHDHWGRDVCKGLAGDANNLWRELTLWAILAGYPAKLLEFAVQPEKIAFLQSLPVETLADMQLHAVGTEQAWSQVEIFLKDVKPEIKDDASFLKLGTSASGRLGTPRIQTVPVTRPPGLEGQFAIQTVPLTRPPARGAGRKVVANRSETLSNSKWRRVLAPNASIRTWRPTTGSPTATTASSGMSAVWAGSVSFRCVGWRFCPAPKRRSIWARAPRS